MRAAVAVLVSGLTCAALSACSPPITAVVGVGLDAEGRLVVAVHVCDGDVAEAELERVDGDDYETVVAWRRADPMTGTESWPVDEPAAGRWERVAGQRADLAPGDEYAFWAASDDDGFWGGGQSRAVTFTAADLKHLQPGRLLVSRLDSRGNEELSVIPLDSLGDEECIA